jgi:hypothetical protein
MSLEKCKVLQTLNLVARSDLHAQSLVKLLAGVIGLLISLALQGCGESNIESMGRTQPGEPVFTIEGTAIRLVDNVFESEDGTVSLVDSTRGDVDNDGHDDLVAVLVLNSKGSGVFYYLNVLLGSGEGDWRSAGEEFLGDRIDFDFITIYGDGSTAPHTDVPVHPDDYGVIVLGFGTRSADQSFAEAPKLYITRSWRVIDGKIISTM